MKLKSTFLLTVLFLFLGITTSFAANWQDEGVSVKPSQTDSTFHITTAEELAWVAMKTNSGTSFSGYTIELMNDIDISSKEWTPIGNANANFKGDFEGNNHTINGLNIGTQNTPVEYSYVGLFGYTCDANIQNIGVTNAAIYSSGKFVGGLVGYSSNSYSYYYGDIKNCYTLGNINGASNVGGLVGYINSYLGIISNCYSTSNVNGTKNVGGLVGYNSVDVINCYAIGDISGTENVGGLIGRSFADNIYGVKLISCYWNKNAVHIVDGTILSNAEKLGVGTGDSGYSIFSKTSAEMKSEDFAALLNEYVKADEELYSWEINKNVNDGYPILSKQYDENLFWIANVQEPELVNDTDYRITNSEELAWVSKKTMEGETFEGYTFYLMNDIDLLGKQWTPIGGFDGSKHNTDYHFAGTFDGCGHTISNMTIGTEKYARVYDYNGLFGYCGDNANIKNLGMENVLINGASYTGGIVGSAYGGIVTNCYVTGIVKGISYIGGIIGRGEKIENSYSYADVKATGGGVGGICGSAYYINNCYSISNVEGNSTVGAICGELNHRTLSCYWNLDCTLIADGLELNGSNKKGVAYGTDNTTAKSLAELKQADTYTNWDFTDVWGISASFNDGLPYLKWQLEGADVVKVSEITLSETVLNLTSKSKYQLKAAAKPSNAADTSITWSSSDENVAVVDKNGIVTAISDGEAVITAKNGDVTAGCTVTVTTPDYIVCEISDMKIKDSAGKELSKLPSGNFIAELSINVKKDTDKKGYVIVSAYDENGVLVDMGYIYTDINSLDDISFGILIRGTNVANIKAFVWEDLQNITPLANSIEL